MHGTQSEWGGNCGGGGHHGHGGGHEGQRCSCGCGCSCHQGGQSYGGGHRGHHGGCSCGSDDSPRLRRRFYSKQERSSELEAYLKDLEAEALGVREALAAASGQ
jgi:hypothetical protein